MSARWLVLLLAFAVGCADDTNGGDDDGPLGGSRTVSGEVVDFETGDPVSGAASVATSGLLPAPGITTQGASFTIVGVPDNSTFQILASVSPTHRATFGPSVDVLSDDLSGVQTPAVSETFLASLAAAFNVTPSAANGVLLAQLVDETGAPKAGVPAAQIVLAGGVEGPFFLDADLVPDDNLTASSASGYVVFFEVPAGLVELGQAAAPTVSLAMPASPINAGAVTLSRIVAGDGAPDELPTNVSLANDIRPIFQVGGTGRGCVACHSGGGIGKDLGGLKLDGPAQQLYAELVEEDPTRVIVGTPEMSQLLRMPSRENPADTHPNVTFASSADPDYVKILVWITEGAKNN
jgi:hypothetical protein